MNPQTKKIIVFLLIVAAVVAVIASIVIIKKRTAMPSSGGQIGTSTQQNIQKQQIHIVPRLTRGVEKGKTPLSLELRLKPGQAVGLTAFTVKASLSGENPRLSIGKPVASKLASSQGWTFPILTAKTDTSGMSVLYVSGVFIAADPYQLTGELPIVTIPIGPETVSSMTISLDSKETKFVTSGTENLGAMLDRQRIMVETP